MELGLWGSLWANCALSTTYFAFPNLPIFDLETEDSCVADDNNRQDHETQTTELSFSDSEASLSPDNSEEPESVQINCSTDSNSFQSISETNTTEILPQVEIKQKKIVRKKTQFSQRNRYSREEYRCSICPYTCTTEKAFLRHLRFHTETEYDEEGEKKSFSRIPRLSCPVCGKDRSGESALNKHMLRHRDKNKNFCCDICSFKTIQLKKLIQHRRMHTGERPHLCPHCVYRAARRDNLRSHVRRVHKRDNLTCDTFNPRGMLLLPSSSNNNISPATTTDELNDDI